MRRPEEIPYTSWESGFIRGKSSPPVWERNLGEGKIVYDLKRLRIVLTNRFILDQVELFSLEKIKGFIFIFFDIKYFLYSEIKL